MKAYAGPVNTFAFSEPCSKIDWGLIERTNECLVNPFNDLVSPFQDQQEKEANMACNSLNVTVASAAQTAPDNALRYIQHRLCDEHYVKLRELHKLYENPRPKSIKETKEWLKSGNFRFDHPKSYDETSEFELFEDWKSFFSWGKEAPDMEKHTASQKKLDEAYQKAVDLVHVVTDEDKRLQALLDFEAFTVN